jgi:pyrroline-5-carboxylate reductase
MGAIRCETPEILTQKSDFVFLTVKPQIYFDVLNEIKTVARDTCFVDVAAGISIDYVKSVLGFDAPVIRVMPNTPLMYGMGSSALVKRAPVTDEQFDFIRGCFDSCGVTCVVDEGDINTVIAVSGSAPAYIMRFAKCFIDYAVSCGIDADSAAKLVLQVFAGSAEMIKRSERSVSELIDMVTSPNGTTAAGLLSLDNSGFEDSVIKCFEATVKRAEELAK